MTDFHASLDRALSGEPTHWLAPEPLENPSGIPPLGEGLESNGWIDEAHHWPSEIQRLGPLMEAINRSVSDRLMRHNAFAIRRDPAYDDSYLTSGYIVEWKDPEPMVYYGATRAWLDSFVGSMPELRDPICTQELDGLGSE